MSIFHRVVPSALLFAVLLCASLAVAQTELGLYSFKGGNDGSVPDGALIFDPAGNLYGVTYGRYDSTLGTVFKLSPDGTGHWTETVLHNFTGGDDGGEPVGRLYLDGEGNLYGTSYGGTFFELSPPTGGSGPWTQTILHRFTGLDGASPNGELIRDADGNFYGTTSLGGGHDNGGTVYELSPDGSGGWTEKVLYVFHEAGAGPYSGLVMNRKGHLFGTTFRGGSTDGGTAFELAPDGVGGWKQRTIHTFAAFLHSGDGSEPIAGLTMDTQGNLYGATLTGGAPVCSFIVYGCGTIFQLSPDGNGGWKERVIYSFQGGNDGFLPYGELVFDSAGNLYGTTYYGGGDGGCIYENQLVHCGTVFELSPDGSGGWTEKILMSFHDGTRGGQLDTGLVLDPQGNLYGVSPKGGHSNNGLVFEIIP